MRDKNRCDSRVGQVLAERFALLEFIGTGAMGCVYRAEQLALGREVAVKLVDHPRLQDPLARAQFLREARAVAQIEHPNVVRVFDFGTGHDDVPFLVMELLSGRDLKSVLAQKNCFPVDRAVAITLRVLEGLAEAHARGVVHRDLRPANIFLDEGPSGDDWVKVVDFGLSKFSDRTTGSSQSRGSPLSGSPAYQAPEQALGGPTDPRTDVYAAGILMFELVSGFTPFGDCSSIQTLLCHLKEPPPKLSMFGIGDQTSLLYSEIVERALSKEPALRFSDAAEMHKALSLARLRLSQETDPVIASLSCSLCATPLSETQRFCGECGAPVSSHTIPNPRVSHVRSKGMALGDDDTLPAVAGASHARSNG